MWQWRRGSGSRFSEEHPENGQVKWDVQIPAENCRLSNGRLLPTANIFSSRHQLKA